MTPQKQVEALVRVEEVPELDYPHRVAFGDTDRRYQTREIAERQCDNLRAAIQAAMLLRMMHDSDAYAAGREQGRREGERAMREGCKR